MKKLNQEVFFATDDIVKIRRGDIDFFKKKASLNKSGKARLCAHKNINDAVHDMFIVHKNNSYVRPHKHVKRSESFHIISGRADVIVFNEKGGITKVIKMGNYPSGLPFYYRINKAFYHTLFIRSDFLVFEEVTQGPFRRTGSVFAPWSPDLSDRAAIKIFVRRLKQNVKKFL